MIMEAAVVCGGRKGTQEIIVTGGDTWADVFQHMGNMAITWVQHHVSMRDRRDLKVFDGSNGCLCPARKGRGSSLAMVAVLDYVLR